MSGLVGIMKPIKKTNNYWNYSIGIKPGAFNEHKEILSLHFKNDKVIKITSSSEKIVYDN